MHRVSHRTRRAAALLLPMLTLPLITACPGSGTSFQTAPTAGAGTLGATQGGVQDFGLARELLLNGRIPPPEAFVVEGLLSEYELGLDGDACARPLCLRAAAAVTPGPDGADSAWMQVGLSSSIDMDSFERGSVTLIAVVDVSGSMGWDYVFETEYPSPGAVSRRLLHAMVDALNTSDRMAVVTYANAVRTRLDLTAVDDKARIHTLIDDLAPEGSTFMEAGLERGYALARQARDDETQDVRVVLFTDVQPNVGATSPSDFERMAAEAAEDGIGLTVMAVGVGLGQEVLNAMSTLPGGNAFSMFDYKDADGVMEDDWPWLLSPIAYDLDMMVTAGSDFTVAGTYGFPGAGDDREPQLDVSSVFLSRRSGALLVRFEPVADARLADFGAKANIAYTTPEGELVEEQLTVAVPEGVTIESKSYFEQSSVARAVALASLADSLEQAAMMYGPHRDQAIAVAESALERIRTAARDDDALVQEVELCQRMIELMEQGAEQGDLYGVGFDPFPF